jgi:hypothetical protein
MSTLRYYYQLPELLSASGTVYTKTGSGVAGVAASGPKTVGSGAIIYTKTGSGASGVVGVGTRIRQYSKTGAGTATTASSGSKVRLLAGKTGSAASTATGSGTHVTLNAVSIAWPPHVTTTALTVSTAAKLDLNLKQGASTDVVLTVVDVNGDVITNPAGYTIRAQIRRAAIGPMLFEWTNTPTAAQGTAVMTYSAGPPETSTVTLSFTDEQSALFAFKLAQWDCRLTNPFGQSAYLAQGAVRVTPYITP